MKNKTGIANILELLKIIKEHPLTQEEIQERFNIKEKAFYKYVKFIKNAGFDILKKNKKYYINNYSKNIDLDNYETSLIATILVLSENLLSNDISLKVKNAIEKTMLLSDSFAYKDIQKKFLIYKEANNYNIYKEKINLFEELLKKNITAKVTMKSKNIFLAKPYKMTYVKNRLYFNFITEENKVKTILADRIVDMYPEYLVKTGILHKKETIFEIYGKLAKTYVLRDEEVIVDNFEGGIRVSNSSKDKDILFKRLLRYDTLCKIIHPKSDKDKFKELIGKSLININGSR